MSPQRFFFSFYTLLAFFSKLDSAARLVGGDCGVYFDNFVRTERPINVTVGHYPTGIKK